ncbi:Mov34/MPN/PAD-1 family protein [Phenylobacterium koreense]|uniref:Mov34/MPN/PAD-1 family protein n=1 Tax=Phenylobacterium koreense TaxID=266125 RepID=UPI0033921EBB
MTVWIADHVRAKIVEEGRALFPLETGGVLLGWRDGADSIVADLIGAGPKALHGRHLFLPDHAWQLHELRAAFADSRGDLDYLGDWHTHPAGIAEMSKQDHKTLGYLTRRVRGALMVIAAGAADDWTLGAWSQRRAGLFGRLQTDERDLRSFAAPSNWPRFPAIAD